MIKTTNHLYCVSCKRELLLYGMPLYCEQKDCRLYKVHQQGLEHKDEIQMNPDILKLEKNIGI